MHSFVDCIDCRASTEFRHTHPSRVFRSLSARVFDLGINARDIACLTQLARCQKMTSFRKTSAILAWAPSLPSNREALSSQFQDHWGDSNRVNQFHL